MDLKHMRELVEEMMMEGVNSVDPEQLVKENIEVQDHVIKICEKTFSRKDYDEIVLLGIGKASVPMAIGCKKIDPDDGLVITNHHTEKNRCPVEVKKADHPYPTKANLTATKELLSKVEEKENALFIFLVSGGGSALFTLPEEGITISEINELNRLLIKSGANIHEINTVRKHISKVKGGRFGDLCNEKGEIVSLIISDVVGDDLSVIASGPTYPDRSTFQDAEKVLKKYDLWKKISVSIRERITKGLNNKVEETPTEPNSKNFLIGNNLVALKGAKKVADRNDINSMILTSQNRGEAKVVAEPLTAIAKEIQDSGNPVETPAAIIIGGETTVSFESREATGKGGPNRELVLSAAIEIKDRSNIVIASVDSDGVDGVNKAGAIADTSTVEICQLDPLKHLRKHDSQTYFESIHDSIEFESKTNVNDITVMMIEEKE